MEFFRFFFLFVALTGFAFPWWATRPGQNATGDQNFLQAVILVGGCLAAAAFAWAMGWLS